MLYEVITSETAGGGGFGMNRQQGNSRQNTQGRTGEGRQNTEGSFIANMNRTGGTTDRSYNFV